MASATALHLPCPRCGEQITLPILAQGYQRGTIHHDLARFTVNADPLSSHLVRCPGPTTTHDTPPRRSPAIPGEIPTTS